MSLDYYAILVQRKCKDDFREISNTDATTACYHTRIAGERKKDANDLRSSWQENLLANRNRPLQQLKNWHLENFYRATWAKPDIDLALLPPGSWFLQFTFRLAKPYISRGDIPFYIIDNPIVRDKVFQLPLVRPTAWKGNLYAALWQKGYDKEDDEQMQRLFGIANDTDDTGQSGRLYFYPTFFTQIGLEIINPHKRERRVGTNPILFESVPAGAKGTFTLLYVPFDRIGKGENETRQQSLADLRLIAEGLQAMFTLYGFGAKTSSGFGVAEDAVEDGVLVYNLPDVVCPQAESSQVPKPDDAYLKYLGEDGKIRPEFEGSGEGGLMSNREYKNEGQSLGGGSLSEFKAFRQWYVQHGEQWQKNRAAENEETAFSSCPFASFHELSETISQMEVGDE